MHDMPDNSNAPTRFHRQVIKDTLLRELKIDENSANAVASAIEVALFEARWVIIATHIMDAVIERGGVDPTKLAEANNVSK